MVMDPDRASSAEESDARSREGSFRSRHNGGVIALNAPLILPFKSPDPSTPFPLPGFACFEFRTDLHIQFRGPLCYCKLLEVRLIQWLTGSLSGRFEKVAVLLCAL